MRPRTGLCDQHSCERGVPWHRICEAHFDPASSVSALRPSTHGRSAIPIEREITHQTRGRPRDQVADQLRRKKAECDAVAAITIGGVDAFGAGDRTDQGQSVAGGVEGSGPTAFDVDIRRRPQRGELARQQTRLPRDQAIARIGLDNLFTVFAADDDIWFRAGRFNAATPADICDKLADGTDSRRARPGAIP